MKISKRYAAGFAAAAGLLAAGAVGSSVTQADRAEASSAYATPFEECLVDLQQVCRETTPVGPDRVQCFADARETCEYLYGQP
jgi:hypothetical protein